GLRRLRDRRWRRHRDGARARHLTSARGFRRRQGVASGRRPSAVHGGAGGPRALLRASNQRERDMPVASKDLNLLSDGGMHSLYYLVTQDSVTDVEKPDYFKAVQPQLRANDLIIVNCRGPQGTRAVGFFLVTV